MVNLVNNNAELEIVRLSPEEKLWRAVMAQAIFDALRTPKKKAYSPYKIFQDQKDVIAAREWFTNKEETFALTCEALNLNEEVVVKKMTSRIKGKIFQERLERI
jgi:hypothetical protein